MSNLVGVPTVGMIGGGQLARMTHQAGIALGVTFRVLAEGPDVSAAQVARHVTVGDYRDLRTLRDFAAGCDAITFDHEHVPTDHLHRLVDAGVAVRPGPHALLYAQDKGAMRERLTALGVPCPRHATPKGLADLEDVAAELGGWPLVLKTTRGGYDGKGVWVVDDARAAEETGVFDAGIPVLAEERVDYARELSAIVARSPSGQAIAYPVVESVQRDGICHEVIAPAPGLPEELAVRAQGIALRIAGELDVVGLLAVELFETRDGRILVNELAMRPHNTGHWSIEGAVTSQFENHLRAVLDLPLGSPQARAPWTVMVNILGGAYPDMHRGLLHCQARDPALRVHLYGKEVRPARKIGHVTTFGDDLDDVRARARHAAAYLTGEIDE
ncbi:5-(carboxyamino)imidazole ribonucleotide synthase [Actinopolymorpha cephalotaxi]|uniref:N5-carboxyaminoimidazole ribonucleotide synthase n=2 Tax=Actinopolymorpha cephalotaxi TaxID=504797 RepID=A0ABX2S808_9ACTN|nr:5-(carboxyamino)imidazole ribonucleotide synthase [Actinopolymorpha cephalotaxi]NYH84570.1 5-(carboxyamino)imidazole ribonucleotide synthase [Actinopolymorpha cephalotaxi]